MTAIAWAISLAATIWSLEKVEDRAKRCGEKIPDSTKQVGGALILFFIAGLVLVSIAELTP